MLSCRGALRAAQHGAALTLARNPKCNLRRLSTVSGPAGPSAGGGHAAPKISNATGFGAETKAAQGISNRMRKHLLWLVPLVSGLALTTVVRSNKGPKDWVEGVAPGYIDFVRQYWGFDEEELENDHRLRRLQRELARPLSVTVSRAGAGDTADSVTATVRGSMTEQEVLALLKKEHPAFFSALGDAPVVFSFPAGRQEQAQEQDSGAGAQVDVEDVRIRKIIEREYKLLLKDSTQLKRTQDLDAAWLTGQSCWKNRCVPCNVKTPRLPVCVCLWVCCLLGWKL